MARSAQLLSDEEILEVRNRAQRAVSPLKPPTKGGSYTYGSTRTKAGQRLPPYYLVYFLLADLLAFTDDGRSEKVAWSIPVDLNGNLAFIEQRKFGLGIFSRSTPTSEKLAREIVVLINKGVREAAPYFNHLASLAVRDSKLNVNNQSRWLFGRYQFLRELFLKKDAEAVARRDETVRIGRNAVTFIGVQLARESKWLGVAAIDAFFSWIEHVLIHISILNGRIATGEEVARLAEANWHVKVETALNLNDKRTKHLFDELLLIRRQIRNYVAHGAFGKQGEAFKFHSQAGAVPVILADNKRDGVFSLLSDPSFNEGAAIDYADKFIEHLWTGTRRPAKLYIQDAGFPVILPYAKDGTYRAAMSSEEAMDEFVEHMGRLIDNAANMDW